MTTELRDYGDNKTIVLYTDERETLRKFRNSTKVFKIILCEQEQAKKGVTIVGFDLYFPKKWKSWVEKQLQAINPEKVAKATPEKSLQSKSGRLI